jgi:hypothetical protein
MLGNIRKAAADDRSIVEEQIDLRQSTPYPPRLSRRVIKKRKPAGQELAGMV